jgi:hypothetical protein
MPSSHRLREPADNANFTFSQAMTAHCGLCQTVMSEWFMAEKSSQVIQGRVGRNTDRATLEIFAFWLILEPVVHCHE